MAIRLILVLVFVVCASAQYYEAPTITSQQSNILRSFGNLGQVSTYSKSIDTPFSSVRKSDIRVSNPGAGIAYAAPAYAAPAFAGPVVQKAIVGAPGLLGVAYSAAPAVAHATFSNALGYNYAW